MPTQTLEPQTPGRFRRPLRAQVEASTRARVTIRIAGELDLATADEVEACIAAGATDATVIALDLRGVDFIDCAGLRSVARACAAAHAAGVGVEIASVSEPVQRLLGLLRPI